MNDDFKVGELVRCKVPGSWVDEKFGIILKLNVTSSDNINGHLLSVENAHTVVGFFELEHL